MLGTAFIVTGYLAVTARHVIEHFLEAYPGKAVNGVYECDTQMWLTQILQNEELYATWEPHRFWLSPHTDIALIHLRAYCESAAKYNSWKRVPLHILPPRQGERIVGFGYHSSQTGLELGSDGTRHYNLNDKPTAAVGEIIDVHHIKRDSTLVNFPSFQVNTRFDPGMSGGPIFNDNGHLCGVISVGCTFSDSDEDNCNHHSYGATLWPLMGTVINADRGDSYPRGIFYPVLELAQGGQIPTVGWEKIRLVKESGSAEGYQVSINY